MADRTSVEIMRDRLALFAPGVPVPAPVLCMAWLCDQRDEAQCIDALEELGARPDVQVERGDTFDWIALDGPRPTVPATAGDRHAVEEALSHWWTTWDPEDKSAHRARPWLLEHLRIAGERARTGGEHMVAIGLALYAVDAARSEGLIEHARTAARLAHRALIAYSSTPEEQRTRPVPPVARRALAQAIGAIDEHSDGWWDEGLDLLETMIAAYPDDTDVVRLLASLAVPSDTWIVARAGSRQVVQERLRRARGRLIELLEEANDRDVAAGRRASQAANAERLAALTIYEQSYDVAAPLLDTAHAIYLELDRPVEAALVDGERAILALHREEIDIAAAIMERVISELQRQEVYDGRLATMLANYAGVLRLQGLIAVAHRMLQRAAAIAERVGDRSLGALTQAHLDNLNHVNS